MLFVISVSLLVGVVKVRAPLGEGKGSQDLGSSNCPSAPPLVTTTGWEELAAELVGGGILGDPT